MISSYAQHNVEVRPEYAAGTWNYALGRPAEQHNDYRQAVLTAERAGWNPWWIRTYSDVSAVLQGAWFSDEAASHVVQFFRRYCRIPKGKYAGKPFIPLDWQEFDFLRPLFGWKMWSDEHDCEVLRFSDGSLWIPKKQGKSLLCSGLGLYLLMGTGEIGGEVYSAAGDRKQASIIHGGSSDMVRRSPELMHRLTLIDSRNTILYKKLGAVYRALSADASLQEGLNWHGLLFDELHVQKKRVFWDTLAGGGAARIQPLRFSISTAGEYDPTSIGWEQWEIARQVQEGTFDTPRFFALRYYAAEESDWKAQDTWTVANPSIGFAVMPSFYANEVEQAQVSPAKQNYVRRYFLNQWVQAADAFIPPEVWQANSKPFDLAALDGKPCYAGLDLSSVTDLTAFALVFPPDDDDPRVRVLVRQWMPSDNVAERVRKDDIPYNVWIRDGWVKTTPGNCIDYEHVFASIMQDAARYKIQKIAFDPWRSTEIIQRLQGEGLECVEFRQSFQNYTPAMDKLSELLGKRELAHNSNPALAWEAGNLMVRMDANGNMAPDKKRSKEKIDGMVALLEALGFLVVTQESGSVYDTRGLVRL